MCCTHALTPAYQSVHLPAHPPARTYLIHYVRIHFVSGHQLLNHCQLTTVAGQKEAVQILLHIEVCDVIERDMLNSSSTTYLVPETGVEPSLLDEVPHHLGVALLHCIVETAMSVHVQVKLAFSKFGHEVLDNLQVASNSSKVEGVQKVL